MTGRPHQLNSLVIGDDPTSWSAAGFAVTDGRTRVGDTTIALVGTDAGRGILAASVDQLTEPVDGLPFAAAREPDSAPRAHRNGVIHFDHLVAMTPDIDRTTAALLAVGLEHRRTRTFETGGRTTRQSFFWLGNVILELVGQDDAHDPGPATLWGLALTSADLGAAAADLGDALGRLKPAVQPGREIATVRTKELGISVPIALMTPHPGTDA